MKELTDLRQHLHRHPELSNREEATSARISEFLARSHPDRVLELAGTGRAFIYEGSEKGHTVMFRAELDALPITETGNAPYRSENEGVSHVCGHDGHMAILAGLGLRIAQNRPRYGRAVILFQPAEEMEQGARDVIRDPGFRKISPDYIFALHNIPGRPAGLVILKDGSFAAASRGMTIRLTGKSSHAGEPEHGINPAGAVAKIIQALQKMNMDTGLFTDLAFTTVIHLRLGEIAFGTSPGYGELRVTLRAFENSDMELLIQRVSEIVSGIAVEEHLQADLAQSEIFPATVNDPGCVGIIADAAGENELEVDYLERPFRWSEDFGYYSEKYRAGFFGLGSGIDQPALHNPDFDFPDDLIDPGVRIMDTVYRKLCIDNHTD